MSVGSLIGGSLCRMSLLGRGRMVSLLSFGRTNERVRDSVGLPADDTFVLLLLNNPLNSNSVEF